MNHGQIVIGLQSENRQLRDAIQKLQQNNAQADFIEKLTIGALTGYCAANREPQDAAEMAHQAAEMAMQVMIRKVRAADKLVQEEIDAQNESTAKQKAGSVEQVVNESNKRIAQNKIESNLIIL